MPEFYTVKDIGEILDTIKGWVGKDKTSLNELEKQKGFYLTSLGDLQQHAATLEEGLNIFYDLLGTTPKKELEKITRGVNSYINRTSEALKKVTPVDNKQEMYHQTIKNLFELWVPINLASNGKQEIETALSNKQTFTIDISDFLKPLISFYKQHLNHEEQQAMENIILKYEFERSEYLKKTLHP